MERFQSTDANALLNSATAAALAESRMTAFGVSMHLNGAETT